MRFLNSRQKQSSGRLPLAWLCFLNFTPAILDLHGNHKPHLQTVQLDLRNWVLGLEFSHDYDVSEWRIWCIWVLPFDSFKTTSASGEPNCPAFVQTSEFSGTILPFARLINLLRRETGPSPSGIKKDQNAACIERPHDFRLLSRMPSRSTVVLCLWWRSYPRAHQYPQRRTGRKQKEA